jgi:hypothetical protein
MVMRRYKDPIFSLPCSSAYVTIGDMCERHVLGWSQHGESVRDWVPEFSPRRTVIIVIGGVFLYSWVVAPCCQGYKRCKNRDWPPTESSWVGPITQGLHSDGKTTASSSYAQSSPPPVCFLYPKRTSTLVLPSCWALCPSPSTWSSLSLSRAIGSRSNPLLRNRLDVNPNQP